MPNLCVFLRYAVFRVLASLMMASLFFRVCGTHQLKAGSRSMPCDTANSAVSIGCDSFKSFRGSQDVDPSRHWQQSCHPAVVIRRRTRPAWSTDSCWGIVSALSDLRKSTKVSSRRYWFPSMSHCEYIDSAITLAVSSATSPSSNSTLYVRVSSIGLLCARPMGLPSLSRLRLTTRPFASSPPRGKASCAET